MKKTFMILLVALIAVTTIFATDARYGIEIDAEYTTDFGRDIRREGYPEKYLQVSFIPKLKLNGFNFALNFETSLSAEGTYEGFSNQWYETLDRTTERGLISYCSYFINQLSYEGEHLSVGLDRNKEICFDSITNLPGWNFNDGLPLYYIYDGDRLNFTAFVSDIDTVSYNHKYYEAIGSEIDDMDEDGYAVSRGANITIQPLNLHNVKLSVGILDLEQFTSTYKHVYLTPEVALELPTTIGNRDVVLRGAFATHCSFYDSISEGRVLEEKFFDSFVAEAGLRTSAGRFDVGMYAFFDRNAEFYQGEILLLDHPCDVFGGRISVDYNLPSGKIFMSAMLPLVFGERVHIATGTMDKFDFGIKCGDKVWVTAGVHASDFFRTMRHIEEFSSFIDVVNKMCSYKGVFVNFGVNTEKVALEADFNLVSVVADEHSKPGFEATFKCRIGADNFLK